MAKYKLIVKDDPAHKEEPVVEYTLTVEEVFTPAFVQRHTGFDTIYVFLNAGGFDVTTPAQLETVPERALDKYIKRVTSFDSWDAMFAEAATQSVSPNLSL